MKARRAGSQCRCQRTQLLHGEMRRLSTLHNLSITFGFSEPMRRVRRGAAPLSLASWISYDSGTGPKQSHIMRRIGGRGSGVGSGGQDGREGSPSTAGLCSLAGEVVIAGGGGPWRRRTSVHSWLLSRAGHPTRENRSAQRPLRHEGPGQKVGRWGMFSHRDTRRGAQEDSP